jgi:hypothetical protein
VATLFSHGVWQRITDSAKSAQKPSFVACAYFSAAADILLPLCPESLLVVDASIATVQAGATCPSTLLNLKKKGVQIFSAQHLHAKVYAFDNTAFVGSCNASERSADLLIEAAVELTRASEIQQVRNFVRMICLTELSLVDLSSLQQHYKPPRIPRISVKQSFVSTLVMELLQEQGGTRASQVQPPRAVWESYLGLKWLSSPYPKLTLTNQKTGITVVRPVVEHDHNMTIEIAGAELPRPAILEMRRVKKYEHQYQVHRSGTIAFKVLQDLLRNVHNPLRTHGRDWFLM